MFLSRRRERNQDILKVYLKGQERKENIDGENQMEPQRFLGKGKFHESSSINPSEITQTSVMQSLRCWIRESERPR